MSLLRLLSVGRSLGRISDPPNRYRLTQQSLLPRFGGARRTGEEVTVALQEPSSEQGSLLKKFLTAVMKKRTAKPKKTMNRIEADMASVAPQAFPRGRWTFFRNPFSCAPKPDKTTEGPVQGELSLDAVRPVRNDLSDSDFEITRRSRPTDLAEAGAESIATVESSPVGKQLVGVEKP